MRKSIWISAMALAMTVGAGSANAGLIFNSHSGLNRFNHTIPTGLLNHRPSQLQLPTHFQSQLQLHFPFQQFQSLLTVKSNDYPKQNDCRSVPEPGTLGLLGAAFVVLGWARRRKSA